jgi:hypothetical protein
MTDREYLELAAKAAGIEGEWEEHPLFDGRDTSGIYVVGHTFLWNPLTDDGDALRLAVKLRLPIRDGLNGTVETGNERSGRPIWELCGDDPLAATRRAIVRAAAEIGRSMK